MSDDIDDDGYHERLAAAAQIINGVDGEEEVPEVICNRTNRMRNMILHM
jgi:hypothetical protein